jgi:hypothetical protein
MNTKCRFTTFSLHLYLIIELSNYRIITLEFAVFNYQIIVLSNYHICFISHVSIHYNSFALFGMQCGIVTSVAMVGAGESRAECCIPGIFMDTARLQTGAGGGDGAKQYGRTIHC